MNDITYRYELLSDFNDLVCGKEIAFYNMVNFLNQNKSRFNHLTLIEMVKLIKKEYGIGLRECKYFFDILILIKIYIKYNSGGVYVFDSEINLKDLKIELIKKSIIENFPYKNYIRKEKIKKIFEN
jgi:hypothetical protein